MLPLQNEKAVFFGPQRALLRALLLKDAESTQSFAKRFSLDVSEVLSANVFVPREVVLALWQLNEQLSGNHPMLPLEAARLFQISDLGDRGWLFLTARNLQAFAALLQEQFADFNLNLSEGSESFSIKWCPRQSFPSAVFLYIAAICLHQLLGQGIPVARHVELLLPVSCRPESKLQESILLERLFSDFGFIPNFSGHSLSLKFEAISLSIPFRNADESVFQFFIHRIEKSQNRGNGAILDPTPKNLGDKVREILLRNISRSDYGSKEVASELGISTRTLERSLAREKFSLREVKQELQRSTAEEMLSIGVRAKEVAAKIGFADETSFSRAFHKWTGTSPTQFKKRMNDER